MTHLLEDPQFLANLGNVGPFLSHRNISTKRGFYYRSLLTLDFSLHAKTPQKVETSISKEVDMEKQTNKQAERHTGQETGRLTGINKTERHTD